MLTEIFSAYSPVNERFYEYYFTLYERVFAYQSLNERFPAYHLLVLVSWEVSWLTFSERFCDIPKHEGTDVFLPQTWFSNSSIFTAQCCRPLIFQTMNYARLKYLILKYQRLAPSGSNDIGIGKPEFVSRT